MVKALFESWIMLAAIIWRRAMRMRNRQSFTVRRRGGAAGRLLTTDEITFRDESGFHEDVESDLEECEFGCVIHGKDEIGGVAADTRGLLCKRHAETECQTCRRLVGRERVHLFGNVYCRTHGLRLVLFWSAVALLVLGLLVVAVPNTCGPVYL